MANAVKFGLSNAHYALMGEDGTYETPKPILGSVSLSLSPEGDSASFAADNNSKYYVSYANSGYSGSLEIAFAEDEFLQDTLNYIVDKNGMLLEASDTVAANFALMFEVSSNVKPQRFVLYNCQLSRPETEANTTSDSVEPDTITLDFTAASADFKYGDETRPFVRGSLTKTTATETAYGKFFDNVMVPTALTA